MASVGESRHLSVPNCHDVFVAATAELAGDGAIRQRPKPEIGGRMSGSSLWRWRLFVFFIALLKGGQNFVVGVKIHK